MTDRLRTLLTELMLVPGLSGHEGRIRRHIRRELEGFGLAARTDKAGNLIAKIPGTEAGAPRVMLHTHMDQLGLVVRKIEPDGYLRVERLGGVPDKALPATAVLVCVGEGRDVPGVVGNKSHHATPPDEKFRVLPARNCSSTSGRRAPRRCGRSASRSVRLSSTRRAAFGLGEHRIAGTGGRRSGRLRGRDRGRPFARGPGPARHSRMSCSRCSKSSTCAAPSSRRRRSNPTSRSRSTCCSRPTRPTCATSARSPWAAAPASASTISTAAAR